MDNIIIQGSREAKATNFKKPIIIGAIIGVLIILISFISNISDASKAIESHTHTRSCYSYEYRSDFYTDNKNNDLKNYKMDCYYTGGAVGIAWKRTSIIPGLLCIGIGVAVGLVKRSKSKGYTLSVTENNINVVYSNGKTLDLPMCSIFSVEKVKDTDLSIVTSENSYTFAGMSDRDAVADAIINLLPKTNVTAPTNNEQVLAKGYPPAVKPLLLVLLILFSAAAVIAAIAAEEFVVILIGIVPIAIVLVLYLLAKTPYLVVTDKRVFYVSDFGRKLSMPLNKLTVTVTHWWFKQLHIAAPTGRIHLFGVKNTAQIYDTICALLNEKQ